MKIEWEKIEQDHGFYMYRAKVFGGWLILIENDALALTHDGHSFSSSEGYQWRSSTTFVPDPNHEWGAEQN